MRRRLRESFQLPTKVFFNSLPAASSDFAHLMHKVHVNLDSATFSLSKLELAS